MPVQPAFVEKFIGYVDILGFKEIIRTAEARGGNSAAEIIETLKILGTEDARESIEKHGPSICPSAPRIKHDLDFQLTQVSDCVVVSTEVSPAGIVNLVSHCFVACAELLVRGNMCRGYIKRGMIYHEGIRVFGTGHIDAYEKERQVSAFKQGADERGTPFIEIENDVVNYVTGQPDRCVKEMFGRMVKSDGELTAIFPFKSFSHSFIIGGFGPIKNKFEPEREKAANNEVRRGLKVLKERVRGLIDPGNTSAAQKGEHYIRMRDAQINNCDRVDRMIDSFAQPYGKRVTPEGFPGLFP